MKTGIKIGDIMSRNFIYVKPDTNLIKCAKKMIKKRVGSLIIKDNSKLAGLLTERDIIWALIKKSKSDLKNIKAIDIGTKKVKTIKPSTDLFQAFEKMKKSKYRWLPVVHNKKIVGMLTLKDILRVEPALFESAREIMQIKEQTEKLKSGNEKQGICEECGNFDILSKIDGKFICESCKDMM